MLPENDCVNMVKGSYQCLLSLYLIFARISGDLLSCQDFPPKSEDLTEEDPRRPRPSAIIPAQSGLPIQPTLERPAERLAAPGRKSSRPYEDLHGLVVKKASSRPYTGFQAVFRFVAIVYNGE